MNNFHAVGRIAAEIKLQKNEKGVVYTRFPLAISRGKNKYEKDDKTRYSTSIIADRIEYLDWKDQNDSVDAADDNYYDDCSFSGYEYEDEGDIL